MPHKNAEKMLEYALDATETDEPWLSWYATNQHGDVIEDLSGDIYWGSESWEFYRKKEAQPVPWHLLEDYVHKSAEPSVNKALKSVDLSVLIDSGIDCEFRTGQLFVFQNLSSINTDEDYPYCAADLQIYRRCKPRMNYWFCGLQFDGDWHIIKRLTTAGFEVEDKWDDHYRIWIGFRITGLQDGYCWPWECE